MVLPEPRAFADAHPDLHVVLLDHVLVHNRLGGSLLSLFKG